MYILSPTAVSPWSHADHSVNNPHLSFRTKGWAQSIQACPLLRRRRPFIWERQFGCYAPSACLPSFLNNCLMCIFRCRLLLPLVPRPKSTLVSQYFHPLLPNLYVHATWPHYRPDLYQRHSCPQVRQALSPSSLALSPFLIHVGEEDRFSGLFPYEIKQVLDPFTGYRKEIPAAGSDIQITRFPSANRAQCNWYLNMIAMLLREDYISACSLIMDWEEMYFLPQLIRLANGKYVPTRVPLNFNLFFDVRFFVICRNIQRIRISVGRSPQNCIQHPLAHLLNLHTVISMAPIALSALRTDASWSSLSTNLITTLDQGCDFTLLAFSGTRVYKDWAELLNWWSSTWLYDSYYCTISTDRSHLVMRDAHSSLVLMFTTSGDAWLNEFFDQIVHKIGAKRLNFFSYLQSQFWGCSQVLVMRDESQFGSVHEALWCVMWTIGRNGTVPEYYINTSSFPVVRIYLFVCFISLQPFMLVCCIHGLR